MEKKLIMKVEIYQFMVREGFLNILMKFFILNPPFYLVEKELLVNRFL